MVGSCLLYHICVELDDPLGWLRIFKRYHYFLIGSFFRFFLSDLLASGSTTSTKDPNNSRLSTDNDSLMPLNLKTIKTPGSIGSTVLLFDRLIDCWNVNDIDEGS